MAYQNILVATNAVLQKNVQPSNPYVKEESLKTNDPTVQLKQNKQEGEKKSEQIKPKNVGGRK